MSDAGAEPATDETALADLAALPEEPAAGSNTTDGLAEALADVPPPPPSGGEERREP